MATVDAIYTVAGGAWFKDSLNAVAAFFNGKAGDNLLAMSTSVSVCVGAVNYISSRNPLDLVKWCGFYVLIIAVLLGVKRDVQVIDLSAPSAIYQVDNVPAGVAVPASLISRVGVGLAQTYDTLFSMPDALTYTKTGMLFGAALAGRSTDFTFTSAAEQRMFSDYVHNCVIGDIMLNHKYSMAELMESADPWQLVLNPPRGASPLRGLFNQNREFMTCEEASKQLQQDDSVSSNDVDKYYARITRSLHGFTTQIFGTPGGGHNEALFMEMLGDSYNYFHNTSMSSTDIIRRNTVLNGLRQGLTSFTSNSGDTAGMLSIATETSMAKMRMSQSTSAAIGTQTLPILHTVLFGMVIALFPVLIVLAVTHTLSWGILKGYIYTIAYLQAWPVLYSILNHAMNFYLKGKLGGEALTLSNFDQMQNTYSDIGTTAGWMSLSIPFIAWGMVFGLGKVVSQAGSTLGHTLQGAATQSSAQAVDGTYAFNNMQTDNVQGNKWDTNYGHRDGQITTQNASGASTTLTGSGQRVVDTGGAMSRLAVHVGSADSTIAGLQQQARVSEQQSIQSQQGYEKSKASGWQQLEQFNNQFGNSATAMSSSDRGQSSSVTQAMSQMMSVVDTYAKVNHISREQAYKELTDKSRQASVSASATAGTPKWLGSSVSGSAEARGTSSSQHGTTEGNSQQNGSRHDQNAQLVNDFRKSRDTVARADTKTSGSQIDNNAAQRVSQFAATLNTGQREFEQSVASQSRSHEFSKMASWAEDHRAQIDQNYDQQFADYVAKHAPGEADALLTDTASPEVAARREQLAQGFVQERVIPQLEATWQQNRDSLGGNIPSSVPSHPSVEGSFAGNTAIIDGQEQQAGIKRDVRDRAQTHFDEASKEVAGAGSEINHARVKIEHTRDSLKNNHEKNKAEQEHGMKNEAARQQSLGGTSEDEMTDKAREAQKRGAREYE
ncbi:conjugal transfer mating-pair stabilization protein TraG [Scandinavium goeteborgense]|uniref:Conjugal transfer mating pair stabilization protein TraG n=1 Tax=Scandinavium goeteborgense TaxID=1851514 RepID=A0A4R6E2E9_SCAGO|nr:conjugal transfer mating-pair stabilization protein TraG [Scandinavium goeteborgense]TDN51484.1 conjugal transfer mating pair stabilization protein TraG [Scandinavium goeteborgense]